MMKPIYRPKGMAGEYAELALNIYTGCTNGCTYCYAPGVLRKSREDFKNASMRKSLLEALKKQLTSGAYGGKTIHLCFTCDPYPSGISTLATREAIKALKSAGCHVQILTKNVCASRRDWDLLDGADWLGTTYTGDDCMEPGAEGQEVRIKGLLDAKRERGLNTWVSCEPVLDADAVCDLIAEGDHIDLFKVGKLNHAASDTDWAAFGRRAENMLIAHGRNYMIKSSLRKEMDEE